MKLKFFIATVAVLGICFAASVTHAQTAPCAKSTLTIIPRSPSGSAIPGMSWELYEQQTDVDNNPIGVTRVAYGKVDVTGRAVATFGINAKALFPGKYALKLYDKSSTNGAVWFYDQIHASCGSSDTFEPHLSSVGIQIRNAAQQIVQNVPFALYVQAKDADNKPVVVTGNLVANFTTGSGGEVVTYIASPQTSYKNAQGTYMLVVKPTTGGTFIKSDIQVRDGQKTLVNYVLSEVKFLVRDTNRQSYPDKTRVDFYEQVANQEQTGKLLKSITTDATGTGTFVWPAGTYAARVYGKSISFYFYNISIGQEARTQEYFDTTENLQTQSTCSSTAELTVVAKAATGEVVPNLKTDLLEQEPASSGNTVSSIVVASGVTDRTGRAVLKAKVTEFKSYSVRAATTGVTVGQFYQSNIQIKCGEKKEIPLTLSLLRVKMLDVDGSPLANDTFYIYGQNTDGSVKTKNQDYSGTYKTDAAGFARVFLSPGFYIFAYKNQAGTEFLDYDIEVQINSTKDFTFIAPVAVLKVLTSSGDPVVAGTAVDIFEQKGTPGSFYLGKKLATLHTDPNGNAGFQYPAGVYAAVVQLKDGKQSIHWNVYVNPGTQNFTELVVTGAAAQPAPAQRPSTTPSSGSSTTSSGSSVTSDKTLVGRLAGKILLRVQAHGEAYYVSGKTRYRYYLKDGSAAYELMRKLGVGITTADLSKIPIGLLDIRAVDSDGDGLPDDLERAIGTQPFDADTDSDGYIDSVEIQRGYSPFGPGKVGIDAKLSARVKGLILLQVEDKGEAWYVNPADGKRYYMANGDAAYQIMRQLGLGITDADLNKITEGKL